FIIGVWLCERTSEDLGVHDHSGIVWDEFVGYWLTMFLAPQGWEWALVGFVLFRVFDVLKPWPVKWADRRVAGGFGIMVDDVLAGVYAWLGMQVLIRLW
ncbi:MAG: phosphatidylglycerophosphatase A, partial [Oceanospirillum sp.]|nr:phosphatidylglycerophosphatase A [Oceanospirillum sp.]